jgi:antitoxin FitA
MRLAAGNNPGHRDSHSASRRAFRIARAGTVSTAIDTMLQRWKFGGAWAPPSPLPSAVKPFILIAVLSRQRFDIMPAVTIRNLSEETHRALKVRAAEHNRSAEAEMRAILEDAVRPANRLRLGTALANMSRNIGLTNADVETLEPAPDRKPAKPLRFE